MSAVAVELEKQVEGNLERKKKGIGKEIYKEFWAGSFASFWSICPIEVWFSSFKRFLKSFNLEINNLQE